jgi:hypothetical protein
MHATPSLQRWTTTQHWPLLQRNIRHCYGVHGRYRFQLPRHHLPRGQPLQSLVVVTNGCHIWHPSNFNRTSIWLPSCSSCCANILPHWHPIMLPSWHTTTLTSYCTTILLSLRPTILPFRSTFVSPSSDICPLSFIPINAPYSSNCILCLNFVANVLYCYKILGCGTTPYLQMMRAVPLN